VTAKLLRGMSTEYHEPIFELLVEWVEAGGDPDFAFKYALTRVEQQRAEKELPQQTLSLSPRPELAPVLHGIHPSQHRELLEPRNKPVPAAGDTDSDAGSGYADSDGG
jgi:hypothetical protein